jgi:hypothetical protein
MLALTTLRSSADIPIPPRLLGLDDSNLTAEASAHLAEPICGDGDAAAVGQVVIVANLAAINGSASSGILASARILSRRGAGAARSTTTALSAI